MNPKYGSKTVIIRVAIYIIIAAMILGTITLFIWPAV